MFALVFAFLLSACASGGEPLAGEYAGYYLVCEDNTISVTNYPPDDLLNLPKYQELAQYGDGVGLDNEGVVYYIFITDTSKTDTYYTAEFDGKTRALLCEEGTYFADEGTKADTITRLLDMLDALKGQYIQ